MARFGKSGTDATSAAVRLARAVTGRDHIIMCGYHGWQDWSIGQADTLEHRAGVPEAVRALTHVWGKTFCAGKDVAAIILDCSKTTPELMSAARKEADRFGAILIFDEVITGFRWHIGGAQAYHGVTPDLACFSKAMGNGMPISAVVGRKDLMKNFDHVFFSGTFGGETLSLAAAIATIDKIEREGVCLGLAERGKYLQQFSHLVKDHVWLSGHPSCAQLNFSGPAVREVFLTAMIAEGVLVNTAYNVCFAHTRHDLDQVKAAQDIACAAVAIHLQEARAA